MSDRLSLVGEELCQAEALGLPPRVAALLLAAALNKPNFEYAWFKSHGQDQLDVSQGHAYRQLCARWLDHEPLEYILGSAEFFGIQLQVDARVLVPRPDTESLVEWALDVLKEQTSPSVADLGTGSGAIAIAIQYQRPEARVLAVDASADALAVAQANATRLQLTVEFGLGHWLEPLAEHTGSPRNTWNLIVSNPPYIVDGDPHLPALQHEPLMALTSGPDGLNAIRHIIHHAPPYLSCGGWLLLEHGYDHSEAVRALLTARGFEAVQSRNDLAGIARCTGGVWRRAPDAG